MIEDVQGSRVVSTSSKVYRTVALVRGAVLSEVWLGIVQHVQQWILFHEQTHGLCTFLEEYNSPTPANKKPVHISAMFSRRCQVICVLTMLLCRMPRHERRLQLH